MKTTTLPPKFLERLEKQFGSNGLKNIVSAFGEKRLPTFRANTLKTTDDQIMAVLREENIAFERIKNIPHAFRIKNRTDRELLEHQLCTSGKIYLQGIASMLPPLVLDPKPGETVLDLCAAPGSKTSQMAALMKNSGRLVACDDNSVRFQKLENTLKIQGATFVETKEIDASLLHKEMPATFDKILTDVPCSAEGRISTSDPRSFSFWNEKNIIAHAKLQRRLLRSAAVCLKPGGTLVYSTCTLAPEEDEQMIEWLLQEFTELKAVAFELPVSTIRKGTNNTIYVLPSKEHEGLFVAKVVNCLNLDL
ncbi:MAG: RsmB/NOP family class I SAM-dependent RNA methyltransferase [Candidatus Uhrbacteria bacterium]